MPAAWDGLCACLLGVGVCELCDCVFPPGRIRRCASPQTAPCNMAWYLLGTARKCRHCDGALKVSRIWQAPSLPLRPLMCAYCDDGAVYRVSSHVVPWECVTLRKLLRRFRWMMADIWEVPDALLPLIPLAEFAGVSYVPTFSGRAVIRLRTVSACIQLWLVAWSRRLGPCNCQPREASPVRTVVVLPRRMMCASGHCARYL